MQQRTLHVLPSFAIRPTYNGNERAVWQERFFISNSRELQRRGSGLYSMVHSWNYYLGGITRRVAGIVRRGVGCSESAATPTLTRRRPGLGVFTIVGGLILVHI